MDNGEEEVLTLYHVCETNSVQILREVGIFHDDSATLTSNLQLAQRHCNNYARRGVDATVTEWKLKKCDLLFRGVDGCGPGYLPKKKIPYSYVMSLRGEYNFPLKMKSRLLHYVERQLGRKE
eukprot:PhF_6_TR41147/c0_g1_i2/m.62311